MEDNLRACTPAGISESSEPDGTAIALWVVALAIGALLVTLVVSDDRVMHDKWTRLATPAPAAAMRDVDRRFFDLHRPGNGDPHGATSITAQPGVD